MQIQSSRILICQPIMHSFCGSTLVTIELAEYLYSQGADVTIYTNTYSDQVCQPLKKLGIKVLVACDTPQIKLSNYDLVWVHSQILPESSLKELTKLSKIKNPPFFVFLHMSTLDEIPDEFAWIYQLEDKLADLVLYISDATLTKHMHDISPRIPYAYYRNPAPSSYYRPKFTPNQQLTNLLIVSNHAPNEVRQLEDLCQKANIKVHHLGERGSGNRSISPTDIFNADVVITIGKTAQYCFLANTPVYIYDHFGGPGYLTPQNYHECRCHNFSGKGNFGFKTTKEIFNEITKNYPHALQQQTQAITDDLDDYRLELVIPKILNSLKHRDKTDFSKRHILSISHAERLAQYYFEKSVTISMDYIEQQTNLAKINTLEQQIRDLMVQLEEAR